MTTAPPLDERLLAFIAEQTGLARDVIKRVLAAQLAFLRDHPGNLEDVTEVWPQVQAWLRKHGAP